MISYSSSCSPCCSVSTGTSAFLSCGGGGGGLSQLRGQDPGEMIWDTLSCGPGRIKSSLPFRRGFRLLLLTGSPVDCNVRIEL